MLTRDEIRAVYDQGPEAVIELVESLAAQIATLSARVKALEDRLATNSRNSSKPPSSDAPAHRTRSLRTPSGKKPGAQVGHPGTTLTMTDTPDHVVTHAPALCVSCGASLAEVAGMETPQRRQVFDLPPLRLEVTEHRVLVKPCPACGAPNAGQVPDEVKPGAQYGAGVKALAVCLQQEQLLPMERTCQLLGDLFGQPIAEGTLQAALEECAQVLEPIESQIKQAITQAAVAHFDETGCSVAGHRDWVHVASTDQLTHYAVHPKRGCAATDEIGILPAFSGRAVHDAYGTYTPYECQHALCNAHHLRELTFLHEVEGCAWAGPFQELLSTIKTAVDEAREAGASHLPATQREAFEAHYQHLLEEGFAEEALKPPPPSGQRGRKKQSKAKNLLDRLDQRREEVLAFMYDFTVPFDNNQAERDLRMVKVQQKVSGTFRTREGAQKFCRIRGYISTLKKQGKHVLSALRRLFSGSPVVPALGPPIAPALDG